MKITWQMPTPLLMCRAFTGVMSGFNFHHCLTKVSMIRLSLLKLIVLGFLESTVVDSALDFFFILLFCMMCFRVCLFGIFQNKNIFRNIFRNIFWLFREQNSRNRNQGIWEMNPKQTFTGIIPIILFLFRIYPKRMRP